jgi:hypothetical protein
MMSREMKPPLENLEQPEAEELTPEQAEDPQGGAYQYVRTASDPTRTAQREYFVPGVGEW